MSQGHWIEERDGDTLELKRESSYNYVKLFRAPVIFRGSTEIRLLRSERERQRRIDVTNAGDYR